jgi:hypothetical protein
MRFAEFLLIIQSLVDITLASILNTQCDNEMSLQGDARHEYHYTEYIVFAPFIILVTGALYEYIFAVYYIFVSE